MTRRIGQRCARFVPVFVRVPGLDVAPAKEERVWPGLGFYITNSLLNADMNAVLGGTVVVGCVFIGLNLLSDLLYRALDPRAR